jgi:hypothetical protein
MARSRSALDLKGLQRLAVPEIRAQLGPETLVRRFTILVPVEEVQKGRAPRRIATDDDLLQVQLRLAQDFGGLTTSISIPSLIGWGARDPRRPRQTMEVQSARSLFGLRCRGTRIGRVLPGHSEGVGIGLGRRCYPHRTARRHHPVIVIPRDGFATRHGQGFG